MTSSGTNAQVLHLHGVEIEFPFKPYAEQVDYMECVIKSLQTGRNAILESPTGTGKTLCLLCATLAWRRAEIKKREVAQTIPDVNEPDYPLGWGGSDTVPGQEGAQPGAYSAPRIIYASRTHSQLAQVVNELKRTAYAKDVKVSVLGSREQMCIHPEVSKQSNNTAMIHSCRNKVSKHLCHFYNNVENVRKTGLFTNGVLDIEELVELGKKWNACPYYATREQTKEADCGIIFTPYNYLLDRKARRANNLEVSGNIVIFDEAHNLERICEESASFDLTSLDIAKCILETGELLKAVVKMAETGIVPDGYEAGESNALEEFNMQELATLKALFVHLEKRLQDIPLAEPNKCFTRKGRYMFEFLSPLNVNFGTHEAIIDLVDRVVAYLSTLSNSFQTRGTALQKFSDVVKIIFSAAGGENPTLSSTLLNSNVATDLMMEELSKFYRVHVREEEAKPVRSSWNSNNVVAASADGVQRTLSYWCFSPGYAMRDLLACGVRNLILTSGTLSPISSFTSELQVDFPIQLQNTHVIDDHQIFVATVKKTLSSRRLESTFKTRNDYALAQDIGELLLRIADTCPGGLLVFFPSYVAMEGYMKKWGEMSSDIMRKIDLRKPCTVESRSKNSLKDSMEKYYSDVVKPQGASFFAICRGKVSEGLDFANNNGRVVVIIGLPFPPAKDAKVREKMNFLQSMRTSGATNAIDGQTWYRLQALRAVNQAIGRVIRHRYDYGAILLLDYRYADQDNFKELPKWIKSRVNTFDVAEKAIRRLKSFFCSIREKEKARLQNSAVGGAKEVASTAAVTSGTSMIKAIGGVFFGGQQSKKDITSQYFSKPNKKATELKNQTLFLSVPKANDLSDHKSSTVAHISATASESVGSCSGCFEGTTKRRRNSEDEDSQNLVPIKNYKKKSKPPSLLDALNYKDVVKDPQEEGKAVPDESSSRITRELFIRDKILDDQRRGIVKKKIKIVKNPHVIGSENTNPFSEGMNATRANGATNSSNIVVPPTSRGAKDRHSDDTTKTEDVSEWDEKELIRGSCQLYLSCVRRVLKGESYKVFRTLLMDLQSKRDVTVAVDALSKILLGDEKAKTLFRAFIRFFKSKEQVDGFAKKCEEITGKRPLGF